MTLRAPTRTFRNYLALLVLVAGLSLPSIVFARAPVGTEEVAPPGDLDIQFNRSVITDSGDVLLEGDVTFRWGDARVQADRVLYRQKRYIEAEGNVLVVWGANRIAGSKMTYDRTEDHGVIEDAIGSVEPEYYFTAQRAEKVGDDLIYLEGATVTTCTQPIPYWSFSVGRARIRVDHYARMRHVQLRARRVPLLYLPYMVWPVKPDRAAGLLFPNFGSTRDRGEVISQSLFLPLGRSADLELLGEYYTRAGWGGGTRLRWIPNASGSAMFDATYIDDRVAGFGRYRLTYRQTQNFLNGFRMIADMNEISDFAYLTDYERELRLASSPTVLARLEMSRNGVWTSLNVRELRREQLFIDRTGRQSTLVQQALPEVEWRGRSRKLGRAPVYVSYESSLAHIRQDGVELEADYLRADFFPVVSGPLSPAPWLDVTPSVSYRGTWYTQSRNPATNRVEDEGVSRSVAGGGLEVVGPKLVRIYERARPRDPLRLKHLIEPRISYEYQQGEEGANSIIDYDEVDRLAGSRNRVNFGVRTRLFARRPRSEPAPAGVAPVPGLADRAEPAGPSAASGPVQKVPDPAAPAEPVEILSFELRQSRALDRDQSTEDRDADGVLDPGEDRDADGVLDHSRYSDLEASGRFNPGPGTSLDMRMRYDPLQRELSQVSLSGNLRGEAAHTGFTIVRRTSVGPELLDRTQILLASGVKLLGGKIRFDVEGSVDLEERRVPNQRYRMEFYTQCCGFLAEYLARDFEVLNRREFRFTVDLRGIGKFIDLHDGGDR